MFKTYHTQPGDSPETQLLKVVANRLNLAESENPGGKYLLAAIRPDINRHLDSLEPPEIEEGCDMEGAIAEAEYREDR